MDKISITAEPRTVLGKQNKRLRAEGKVPGVVYGHGAEPQSLTFDGRQLEKTFAEAGTNKLLSLTVGDDKSHNVLFHEIQRDSLSGALTHVDLYLVKMDEKIRTEVPLRFTGESTAVYQQEGTLLKNIEAVEVEALPGDLPEAVEVDISVLDDFEKTIHVSDLSVPNGVIILDEPEELVVKVDPPRSEEELAELEAEVVEELPEGAEEDQEVVAEDNEDNKDNQEKPE